MLGVPVLIECRYCNAMAARLYTLPPRLRPEQRAVGPACYFCFIRATGLKPTRRQVVTVAARHDVMVRLPRAARDVPGVR
jgi:hypothetical protein